MNPFDGAPAYSSDGSGSPRAQIRPGQRLTGGG
jgi:hypothetical protein